MENKDRHAKMLWIDDIAVIEPTLIIPVGSEHKMRHPIDPYEVVVHRGCDTLLIEPKSPFTDYALLSLRRRSGEETRKEAFSCFRASKDASQGKSRVKTSLVSVESLPSLSRHCEENLSQACHLLGFWRACREGWRGKRRSRLNRAWYRV